MSDVLLTSLDKGAIESLEGLLLQLPPADIQIIHTFVPGLYIREMRVKANTYVLGHEHLGDHFNVLLKGSLDILSGSEEEVINLSAPLNFVASAGVRKLAKFHEDSVWLNVMPNPDDERDIEKLDARFVKMSPTFLTHQKNLTEALPPSN